MKELKPGERVKFYGLGFRYETESSDYCLDPCVVQNMKPSLLESQLVVRAVYSGNLYEVHSKQCRRLKKRCLEKKGKK